MTTILHIDPDEAAQELIQSVLGQQYNVVTASDTPTAVQYCAMIQPDLILINSVLPNIDGQGLVARLKMFMPQTPILVITDHQPPPVSDTTYGFDDPHARSFPADNHLIESIDIAGLLPRVQSLVPAPVHPSELATLWRDPELPKTQAIINRFEAQIAALNRANKRLASLNAVSALIGTSLDLEHLTDEILAQIHKTVDFDSATLFLLKGNILEAAASRGLLEYRQGMNTFSENERNSAWRAVYNKLPLIINDVAESKYWEVRPELSKIRSWLGVPLIYKDRVVGVLTLDKNEPNAFTDADARYIFTLAYQIAIAVENAQLFEEWEEQSTRLKLINEVSQEINTLLNVDELFEALARAICERLNYDQVFILEVDQTRSLLTLRAIYGEYPPQLEVGVYQQDINLGLIGAAVQTGQPVLANDVSQGHKLLLTEKLQAQSALIVPFYVSTQVEAVICVARNHVDAFGDQDIWTLSSLASQAGIAIKNAWLYRGLDTYSDELERTIAARTQRLQAIKKFGQVVSQGLDIDELLAVVGRGLGQVFAAESTGEVRITIGLVNGSNVALKTIFEKEQARPGRQNRAANSNAAAGCGASTVQNHPASTIKIDPKTVTGQVITQAKPKILRQINVQDLRPLPAGMSAGIIESVLMAPLITGGKTIGLIMIESQTPNAYGDGDLETLETLAFQVAGAIEHARLLRKTKELAVIEERTRLARDMHDGVAQNLAYLLIQVDRCLNNVEEGSKLEVQLEQIGALLKQDIDELRRNIFDLRPVELEGKALFKVLENFVTEFGRRWNLQTSCTVPNQVAELSPDVERSLYRILQETLSNARQHAECSRLSVTLALKDDQWIALEVQDDGQGFDPGRVSPPPHRRAGKGLGLVSMRERVERVGGQFTVDSAPGRGTRIVALLPLSANRVYPEF